MSKEKTIFSLENDFEKLGNKYDKNKLNISFNRVAFNFFTFVIVLFILFEVSAQIFLTRNLYKFKKALKEYITFSKAYNLNINIRDALKVASDEFLHSAPMFAIAGALQMDEAKEISRQYMGTFVYSNFEHYELMGDHFAKVKGYDAYAAKIEVAKEVGIEGIIDGFMEAAVWGTPDRILREFEKRLEVIGDFELATSFRFGGTPYQVAEQSIKLFAKEVLPVLKSWEKTKSEKPAK